MSDEPLVTLMPPFLRAKSAAFGGIPLPSGPVAGPQNTSLDEERREIVASVLGALTGNSPDPDEMAACIHLLKHLADTAGRPASAALRGLPAGLLLLHPVQQNRQPGRRLDVTAEAQRVVGSGELTHRIPQLRARQ